MKPHNIGIFPQGFSWMNIALIYFAIGMFCNVPFAGGTVIVFTVFDIFAELESWGRVTLGRFNASGAANRDWPIPNTANPNSQTVELKEIRLLNHKLEWVKSHRFDSSLRNFAVSNWHEERYFSLKAHARKIETVRLGEVNGKIDMLVYVITENGQLNMTSSGTDRRVIKGDVIIVIEMENVTEGCTGCELLEMQLDLWGHCQGHRKSNASGLTEMRMTPGDAQVWLPNTVLLDDDVTSLSEGFPIFEQWDTSALVTLRMPAPKTSAAYHFVFHLGGESTAHLIQEKALHKIYGHENDSATNTDDSDQEQERKDGKTKDKDDLTNKNKDNNVNPEYKHVKETSTSDTASSELSLNYILLFLVTVISFVIM